MPKWNSESSDRIAVGRGRLRKLLASGVWHFMFKNEHGEWTSRSTGHRDKRGAIRWAEAFSMRLTGTEFGLTQPEKHKGDDLIGPAFDEWLDYQKVQNTFYTWRSYRSIVKKFREFLATKPRIKRLRHVTADTAMEFRRWAVGRSGSKVTVDNNLVALRSAFNYYREQ